MPQTVARFAVGWRVHACFWGSAKNECYIFPINLIWLEVVSPTNLLSAKQPATSVYRSALSRVGVLTAASDQPTRPSSHSHRTARERAVRDEPERRLSTTPVESEAEDCNSQLYELDLEEILERAPVVRSNPTHTPLPPRTHHCHHVHTTYTPPPPLLPHLHHACPCPRRHPRTPDW